MLYLVRLTSLSENVETRKFIIRHYALFRLRRKEAVNLVKPAGCLRSSAMATSIKLEMHGKA